MAAHWQQLLANFAIVALFISAWVHGQALVSDWPRRWRQAGLGLTMGMGAIVSMLLGIFIDGALFDLRITLIAIAGYFGGPVAAAIAAGLAMVYRASLVGGAVTAAALLAMVGAALLGLVTAHFARRSKAGPLLLGAGVGAISLGTGYLLLLVQGTPIPPLATPLAVTNAVAATIAVAFIARHLKIERENRMLRTAFAQAPDLQYIKSRDSRFVVVNRALARFSGAKDPAELAGTMDSDVLPVETARLMVEDDRRIMETGQPQLDVEERLTSHNGQEQWFRTSKIPLFNADNEIVGIAGWTRDITANRHLQDQVIASRNELSYVLAEITDGIAMFDANGTLVYCNDQYKSQFPRTARYRVPGNTLRFILERVLEEKEQLVPAGKEQQWLDEISDSIHRVSEEEVELFDGRWLYLRTRPTADGSAMVVVSDITKIKQAEHTLQTMAQQLKLLATTDGLTGLTNRRAFDDALEEELLRARRTGEPLSLLLADVDHFKAYNDIYGHQAGDDVLRKVGQCLRNGLRRPGDVSARYGGEEFVAILPATDEDGAFFIADAFRESIAGLGIAHAGAEGGIVTASVGLATFSERDAGQGSAELVRRADEALYLAKGAGRNRVTGWRARHEVRQLGGLRA